MGRTLGDHSRVITFPRPPALPRAQVLVLITLGIFVLGLSFAPLLRLVWAAVAPDGIPDLSRLLRLLNSSLVAKATFNTLTVAFFATLLATALGTAAAVLVALTDIRAKAIWVFAFILPMMIPPQVTALAWVQAWSPTSPVLQFLGFSPVSGDRHPLYSPGGIVLLLGIYNAPLVFFAARAALRRLPADLIEAARASGSAPCQILGTIILPLARPGILAGTALAFVSAAGNFGIQAMLGIPARYPTLITLIYQRLNSTGPTALPDMAILSLVIAAITVFGLVAASWFGGRRDVRVDGANRNLVFSLGITRLPTEIMAWLFIAAILLMPLSALATTSLVTGFGQAVTWETLTLSNYSNALFHHASIRNAFLTSFWISSVTAVVLVLVSIPLAYFISWQRTLFVRLLQLASEIAYALPGVVIGVAMILFFLKPLPVLGFSIYGTVWIILAAYFSNFMALSLRQTLSGFAQIDRSMEEAASVFGASFLRRLYDIVWPLAAPAAAAGAIIVFLTALNEIQVSILLVSSSVRTIGPMVIFLEEGGSSTLAAAVGCLMIVIVLLLTLLATLLSKRLPRGVLPWQD